MSDRDFILGLIRAATEDVPQNEASFWDVNDQTDPAATFATAERLDTPELIRRFSERASDYGATVTSCDGQPKAIREAIDRVCQRHRAATLVVPPGLREDWRPDGLELLADDPPLTPAQLDSVDGVITGCALAIAETGTLALDASGDQGRRALTLIPDLHICVVFADRLVYGVPAATALLRDNVARRHAPITLISGPSATSDIELSRVEGVHGPRRLEILMAGPVG